MAMTDTCKERLELKPWVFVTHENRATNFNSVNLKGGSSPLVLHLAEPSRAEEQHRQPFFFSFSCFNAIRNETEIFYLNLTFWPT